MLQDGKYLTIPIHGHPNATREVVVSQGAVRINNHSFAQDDFFKVNRLAERSVDTPLFMGDSAVPAKQLLETQ